MSEWADGAKRVLEGGHVIDPVFMQKLKQAFT